MPDEIMFTNKEEVVGFIETHSGSVVLVDGIVEPDINLSPRSYVSLDLHLDKKRIPVVAVKQNGRRFLLLPLDAAGPIQNNTNDKVDTEDPVEVPEEVTTDDNDK